MVVVVRPLSSCSNDVGSEWLAEEREKKKNARYQIRTITGIPIGWQWKRACAASPMSLLLNRSYIFLLLFKLEERTTLDI